MVYTFGGRTPEAENKTGYETPNQNNVSKGDYLIDICNGQSIILPITEIRPLGCTGKNEVRSVENRYDKLVIITKKGEILRGENASKLELEAAKEFQKKTEEQLKKNLI